MWSFTVILNKLIYDVAIFCQCIIIIGNIFIKTIMHILRILEIKGTVKVLKIFQILVKIAIFNS